MKYTKGLWRIVNLTYMAICRGVFLHYRSSRPEMLCKKGVLNNFAKFTGKHLCQSLSFNKVADRRAATLFKKRPWHRRSPVNFAKFLRTRSLTENLRWLLPSL